MLCTIQCVNTLFSDDYRNHINIYLNVDIIVTIRYTTKVNNYLKPLRIQVGSVRLKNNIFTNVDYTFTLYRINLYINDFVNILIILLNYQPYEYLIV